MVLCLAGPPYTAGPCQLKEYAVYLRVTPLELDDKPSGHLPMMVPPTRVARPESCFPLAQLHP